MCWVSRLKEWQDLIAGVVGAAALIFTVWITLSRESKRRDEEASALRNALGAELRHFARRSLTGHQELAKTLYSPPLGNSFTTITVEQAENLSRFPPPTIYSQCGTRIGTLGDYAPKVVQFYGQLGLLWEWMRHNEQKGYNAQNYLIRDLRLFSCERTAESCWRGG